MSDDGPEGYTARQVAQKRDRSLLLRRPWRLWFGPRFAPQPSPPSAAGAVVAEAPDLVDQAKAFNALCVRDVMTPRADIVAVEISLPLEDVIRRFAASELTRIPIYRETLDDPVGVVHIKDIVLLLAPAGEGAEQRSDAELRRDPVLHRLRREILYVPASMRCADLLLRMRVARIHMALVIDGFGGVDGLVTLEDLLEAVVGDIDDEHDDDRSPDLMVRTGGVIEADARAALEDLEAAIGQSLRLPDDEEDVDTVAGLVATLAGRVPQRGEVIVHPLGFEFEVTDADPRRIRRSRIRPPQSLDTSPPAVTPDGEA
jgi:CBS domain containing-hemolysin-like protein